MSEMTTTPGKTEPDFLNLSLARALTLDWEKGVYFLFIVLAIVSRFATLGGRVMSHDESLHTQFSWQFYNGDGYNHTPLMHGPFLFHATALSYWLFGANDFTARLPVAILGVLLVAIPYFLRNWLGRVGALFASFFFLISPYLTYYSRYIRHDIYVIVWAMIVVIAMWHYFQERQEKYLWWFVLGTVLMFTTKEVSFIYVAIFGSFLVIRLLPQVAISPWIRQTLPRLQRPILVLLLAVLLIGGGQIGKQLAASETAATTAQEDGQAFAADPNVATPAESEAPGTRGETVARWIQIAGVGVLALGLFLSVRRMRPYVDNYPEFDLIMLFSTLLLPLTSPLLVAMAGWQPRDYSISACRLQGQETMSAVTLLIGRIFNPACTEILFTSGLVRSGSFLLLTMAVSILVGLWWDQRRWLIAAGIFHGIFVVLYTSVFTNPSGWASGMIGSLGYWLEQQEVQRGSQPWFYYFVVTPFYEFVPLIFALAGSWLWLRLKKLHKAAGYWIGVGVLALLAYSLANWLFSRAALDPTQTSNLPGVLLALIIVLVAVLIWFFWYRRRLVAEYGLRRSVTELLQPSMVCEFAPFLIWWIALTWVAYTAAGEKMPWLSTHFVIPMALLGGWYFNERLRPLATEVWQQRRTWILLALTMVLIVAGLMALGPLLLGTIEWGNLRADNLQEIGRFLGGLVAAGVLFYFWRQIYEKVSSPVRRVIVVLSVLGLLSLLTLRFAYMASFIHEDYTTEFMVYAHGAPATKSTVLAQVEDLSMRLHGDKSIRVSFDSDVSWPLTWYLRPSEYPNRHFFGENPSNDLNESPVIIVGRKNWDKVAPYLGNNYTEQTYTFLWWPMEEYRQLSWNSFFGSPNNPNNPNAANPNQQRGLGNAGVRQALWDIFFYRDYTKYGEVFGGTYRPGEWPLRHELKLYIRKDVLANLWDYGVGAVAAEGLEDPYEENELAVAPSLAINPNGVAGGAEGQLNAPRNVAIGPDGRIYAADSGNHRIQVFDEEGNFVTVWGAFGAGDGQFNEPWGLAVDEAFVYVADTWNHRVQKFTLDGEWMGSFGRSGSAADAPDTNGLGLLFGPRDIALLDDGRLLVTDTGNHRLQLLTRDGEFLQIVGGFGNQPGQFNEPVGLSRGPDGTIALADTWNGRIQQLTSDFIPLAQWQVNAWAGQSINNKPYLATDDQARVYVTDPESYRVLIFDRNGDFIGRFGSFGEDVNHFGLPNGIAIDQTSNDIYVADAGNHRILKFDALFGVPVETPDEEPAEEGASEEEVPTEPVEDGDGIGEDADGGETAVSPTPSPSPTATGDEE